MHVLYNIIDLKKCFFNSIFYTKNNINVKNVVIDSRNVTSGSLFFALKGEKNDGHNYIKSAIEKKAECIICEYIPDDCIDIVKNHETNIIVVENSLKALRELAKFQRNRIKAKVIGITGNIGKTTTREMLYVVLSNFFKTYSTFHNYNGQIGLPVIMCNTPLDTEILILEMGMSYKGEMEILSDIAKPDIVIITKISPCHIGNFKDIKEIVKAKCEIFDRMNKNGLLILDKTGDYYNDLVNIANKNGIKNIINICCNEFYITNCVFNDNLTTTYDVNVNHNIIKFKIDGIIKHNPFNSLFVIALSYYLNLDINLVSKSLESFKIVNGRGNFEKIIVDNKKITIINDCYNSSPESLSSSIQTIVELKKILNNKKKNNRVILIIGDMLELGLYSNEYHKKIANDLIDNGVDNIVIIGKESKIILQTLQQSNKYIKCIYYEHTNDFVDKIRNFIKDGDYLMFKASHGMNFDELINKLKYN